MRELKKISRAMPLPMADGVVIGRKGLLLTKRSIPPGKGSWVLPGGRIEAGETAEQAVVREVLEETGLRTKITGLVGVYSEPRRDPRWPTISICFLLRPVGGKFRENDEVSEIRFFKKPPKLFFGQGEMVRDALRLVRRRKRRCKQ